MMNVHWIATAPTGVMSTGPAVTFDPKQAQKYREMGWTVEGPYFHINDMLPSCIECPECGSEVDTRTARAL